MAHRDDRVVVDVQRGRIEHDRASGDDGSHRASRHLASDERVHDRPAIDDRHDRATLVDGTHLIGAPALPVPAVLLT